MRAQAEWGRKENTTSFKRNAAFRCHRSNVSPINVDNVLFTTLECARDTLRCPSAHAYCGVCLQLSFRGIERIVSVEKPMGCRLPTRIFGC